MNFVNLSFFSSLKALKLNSFLIIISISSTITLAQPTASNPVPINVECIGDIPTPDILVVTDEDDLIAIPTVLWEEDISDGLTCPETISRKYRVTGDGGLFIFVTQTITVLDFTPPTATFPSTIYLPAGSFAPAPDILVVVDEADNCTAAPIVSFVGDVSDGLSNPETITRTYCVTDDCGNVTCVDQLIIIGSVGIDELNDIPKQLLKIVDLMGRETKFTPNTPLIYIYSDGTVERVFKLEE